MNLLAQFKIVLENCKKKSAVTYWNDTNSFTTLLYEDVDKTSKNIIQTIKSNITEKNVCLGLYMEHNPFIPSIIISLQKCELAFIFLDPYAPGETNVNITRKLKLQWLIANCQQNHSSDYLTRHATKQADFGNADTLQLWRVNFTTETDNSFKNICFVICTSGTTGEPKVVKVQQECIMSNVISLRKKFDLIQDDVVYFGTPLTFDPSMIELLLALTSGSTLLIIPHKIKLNPGRLLKVLFPKEASTYTGVTFLQLVPSLFLRWSQADIEYIMQKTTCRILAFGGEKFPESILKLQRSDCLRIFNLYGVTEVSCWASVYEVKNTDEDVSVGESLDDTILQVSDCNGLRILDGEGELCIGSFSRVCYINEENESTIIKPMFRSTGDIVRINQKGIFYVCRKNSIIKRLGHRVNLLEIERTILKQTDIPNSCVWLENTRKLILFLAIPEFNPITIEKIVDKLRVKLLHVLPKQCFPDHIQIIPNLPVTKHGKIDKKSLEKIYSNSSKNFNSYKKNSNEIFALLWSKYLGSSLEEIEKYRDCNFFELGGNSIAAIQYLSEFQDLVRADYPNDLTTLLFEKTLRECCEFLDKYKAVQLRKRLNQPETPRYNKIRVVEESQMKNSESNNKLQICWQYNLGACVDSSPTVIEQKNSAMVAVGSFSHIFAVLDSESGNLVSQIILPDTIEGACCAFPLNNHVYVGCYDSKMYCMNCTTGLIIWEYSTGDRIKSTPCFCLQNTAIVFGSYDKYLHCVNIKSGAPVWKTLVAESITSNPTFYKEKLYVATTFGTCLCLREDDGVILWKYKVELPIFGSPCIYDLNDDSFIVWPEVNGTLHSFSCSDGKKQWTFKAKGNIYSSLTKHENFMIFGCHDHNLYCVQINEQENTCCLHYVVTLDSAINSTPQTLKYKENTHIIVATNQGTIYAIELSTGKITEELQLPGEVFSTPAIRNNRFYIGCRDNNLYCLSLSSINDEVNK